MTPPRLGEGDPIEVRTRFNDSWCTGFEVAEVLSFGYRVRRTNDRSLLPDSTSPDDVRPARFISPWA